MAKSKCIHIMRMDRYPLTLCGVDTSLKTGAEWEVEDNEEGIVPTCQNCLKLRDGGQMGAPPPVTTKVEASREEKARWAAEDHISELDRITMRLNVLMSDINGLGSGLAISDDEGASKVDLIHAAGYVENAVARLGMVRAAVHYTLTHKEDGAEDAEE